MQKTEIFFMLQNGQCPRQLCSMTNNRYGVRNTNFYLFYDDLGPEMLASTGKDIILTLNNNI